MKTRVIAYSIFLLLYVSIFSQTTIRKGFADITFQQTDASGDGGAFALGQYDHFITSELSDRVTFLGETVFEYDEGWLIDQERLWIRYSVSDYFEVSVGKFHTALGYWNRAYHHGALLHTSIDRPFFLYFEDEGGILPIHTYGLLFSGSQIGDINFNYDVMIGNGIGADATSDNDKNKSVSGYFHIKPVRDLDVGISFYKDRISAGVLKSDEITPVINNVDQLLLGGNLVYQKTDVELLAEFVRAKNKNSVGDSTGTTNAFYVLASYNRGTIVPYLKYDNVSFSEKEPYYLGSDTKIITIGARYDISYLAAIKLEFRFSDIAGEKETQFVSQFAVVF